MRRPIAIALAGAMVTTMALVAATVATQTLAAEAQPAKAGQSGTTWSSIAHLPDWSGVWELDWHGGNLGGAPVERRAQRRVLRDCHAS